MEKAGLLVEPEFDNPELYLQEGVLTKQTELIRSIANMFIKFFMNNFGFILFSSLMYYLICSIFIFFEKSTQIKQPQIRGCFVFSHDLFDEGFFGRFNQCGE